MNEYLKIKNEFQANLNNFPLFAAFTTDDFIKGKEKLGVKDESELLTLGYNTYIRKSDKDEFNNIFETYRKLKNEKIKNDLTGDGFIYDMFLYEMQNHEFCITGDISDTLDALNISNDAFESDSRYQNAYNKAKKYIYDNLD